MINKDELLEELLRMQQEKKDNKIEPHFILYNELYAKLNAELRDVLNEFYRKKIINGGKTINDKWIMLYE